MSETDFKTSLPLFPYQRAGAEFLLRIGSGLLGDSPGVGKTLQVIALAEHTKAEKILVFCPAVLKHQWANELRIFVPHRTSVVIEGTKKERAELWKKDVHYYLVNYELLLRDFADMNIREWDYIFADEATKISNARAKQSRMIKKLRAKRRISMTGTPISNKAQDCWNLVDWTNPGVLGNYWGFIQRYCLKNQWGGIYAYTNMEELRDKITTDVPFVLSEEEAVLQKKIKQEILHEIQATDINKLETPMTIQYTLTKFTRLRQLADSLELLGENKKSSKLEVLQELLLENIEDGRKVLIFSEFAQMCKILKRELVEYKIGRAH